MDYHGLQFLRESLKAVQNICSWTMTREQQILYTNCPEPEVFSNLFRLSRASREIREHFEKDTGPFIAADRMGFAWIAALQPGSQEEIPLVHLLGPMFTSEMTEGYLLKNLQRHLHNASLVERISRQIRSVPMLPPDQARQDAALLQFSLTGRPAGPEDIPVWNEAGDGSPEIQWGEVDYHGTWMHEQRLFQSIVEGRYYVPDSRDVGRVGSIGGGDPVRQAKNEMIIFSVLLSRGAILGGVSSEGSYNLSDHYIQRIEAAQTEADARKAGAEMYDAFIRRVQYAREHGAESALVRMTLAYIETHIMEKIRLEDIAAAVGYSTFYLSRQFRSETGTGIAETINRRKIEAAKRLMADSRLSVAAVSERLAFSSPSHFYSVFRKLEGVSPKEYRDGGER